MSNHDIIAIGGSTCALERHTLMMKLAADATRRGHLRHAAQFEERAVDYRQQADLLRKAVSDDVV